MPQHRSVRAFSGAVILLAAAAGAAGCDVMVNSMQGGRARAEQAWSKTYTLSGSDASVEIVNVNGPIGVEAIDGDTLDVKARLVARGATEEAAQATLKTVEMREEASAGKVRLEAWYPRGPHRQAIEVTYTVRVPRAAKLRVSTVNGGITVQGALAALNAETTNGSVTGHGLGDSVLATTTNGGIKIEMARVGGDGLSLETTNGSIEVKLPGAAKATVSARCVNGGISVSDLPFEKTGEGSRRKLDGKVNGGGPAMKLETVNGSIRVGPLGT